MNSIVEQYLGNHIRALGSLYQYNISGLISQTVDPVGWPYLLTITWMTSPRVARNSLLEGEMALRF